MGEKKSKKNRTKKKILFRHYKLFIFVGALFHIVMGLFYDRTFYNQTLFWISTVFCGLIFAIYFINKTDLLNPKSFGKMDGFKLKLYMISVIPIMTVAGVILFGSVINGTILGLNYIGKSNESNLVEYQIEKIVESRNFKLRSTKPKVFIEKNGELISVRLSERYNSNKDYAKFKSIEFDLKKGLFGLEVIDEYELKK